MGREDKATWKANYFSKLIQLLDEYPKCFIVGADNVGSKQMQQIRMSLRGTAVILMGKNTMMRKAIKGNIEINQAYEKLLPHIKGNVGFVFTKGDLVEVRNKILENKVRAPARNGAIAPCAVVIPAQNTGLGPEKTSFFQALSIPTKISKGTIEITNDVHILKEGDKVGASDATLLNMLNISPFNYGLVVEMVYDSGTIFEPKILDIKPEDLRTKFLERSWSAGGRFKMRLDSTFPACGITSWRCNLIRMIANMLFPGWAVELCQLSARDRAQGVQRLVAVCLSISYPTVASAPHTIINGFKNLLAVAAATEVEFKEANMLKEYLKDPSKFAAAAVAAAPAPAAESAAPAKKEEEKKKEESESDDDDMGFGLFD